ncbi:MAG: phosphoribosylformylglycinamidine synthase subunit PurL [Bdellovibrionales bacterium]|nr:phosphoribosylformylglycinamidine synthase subunit PurL [Bdellovibrionales bacterium]
MLEQNLKKYRISKAEYETICDLLGRSPEGLEWAVFSALWSEHCSYKSSKVHLKKFYNKNKIVVGDSDENAGVIDLGQGERLAFKMESHNHPSFISHHQGAATGVGGILRDIFTMGARPIALGNYLCFGEANNSNMPRLVDGVVRGIADYGNCVGVPTITGRTHFHKEYNNNILVNAFALGYFAPDQKVVSSKIPESGLSIMYAGAKTGRDGIHGASMASESFSEDSESKKPTIQIGDPFFEKLLIEACIEVIDKNLVVAMQDMGAAGLTSSSFEMSVKDGVGLLMDLQKVPLRDNTLTPEDILLSESQERMLLVCKPEHQEQIQQVFEKWGLDAVEIGQTQKDKNITLTWGEDKLLEIDPELVVEHAPRYERDYEKLSPKWESPKLNTQRPSLPDVASKEWIYQQYDQRVGVRTAKDCSQDIGVVRLPHSHRFVGVAMGCEPEVMRDNAWLGGRDAVVRPCLKLAFNGFTPLALTDCLNFGNPEKKPIMSEFVESVEGISEVCKILDVPVISGNVSFYNETQGQNIISTPATVVVGLSDNILNFNSSFTQAEDNVFVLSIETQKLYENLASTMSAIKSWSQNADISSLAMVSLKGLSYTLEKMSLKGDGVKTQSMPPTEFYQFVVATGQGKEIFDELLKLEFICVSAIGKTQKAQINIEEQSLSAKQLNEKHSKVWRDFLGRFA